jgi:cytochrome c553
MCLKKPSRRGPSAAGGIFTGTGNIMKTLIILVVGLYTCLLLVSLVFADAGAAKLAVERCSACHNTARICEKLGNRTPEVWQQTVQRMKSNGAKLSDAEVGTVAEYLSTAKPGSKPLCQ